MNQSEISSLIETITKKIHFLNFGSTKENSFGYDSPLKFFRDYCDVKAGANDGVVPLSSALMKEHGYAVDFVTEENTDHLMTMTHYVLLPQTYNIKAHTISILKLLL